MIKLKLNQLKAISGKAFLGECFFVVLLDANCKRPHNFIQEYSKWNTNIVDVDKRIEELSPASHN